MEYVVEDRRISLFRQCYKIITDAYDDREETEKDCWDMRKLGLQVNLPVSEFQLNFTPISQPWLKHLAKAFMKYNVAVRSPGDCSDKLGVIRSFSQFLVQQAPHSHAWDIDRALIVAYISFLQERKFTVTRRNRLLVHLRVFFETCAHRLQVPGLIAATGDSCHMGGNMPLPLPQFSLSPAPVQAGEIWQVSQYMGTETRDQRSDGEALSLYCTSISAHRGHVPHER